MIAQRLAARCGDARPGPSGARGHRRAALAPRGGHAGQRRRPWTSATRPPGWGAPAGHARPAAGEGAGEQQEDACWPEAVREPLQPDRPATPGDGIGSSEQQQQSGSPAPPPLPGSANGAAAAAAPRGAAGPGGAAGAAVAAVAGGASSAAPKQPPWPPDVPWGLGKVVQVMGLWLLAYVAMGQLLVPALLALLDIDQAAMSARGAALLNLGLDVGQVLVTLTILVACLARYRPGERGLFPVAWQGGAWLGAVAAGAACFPVVDWLAHSSVVVLSGADGGGGGADVWTAQIESGLYDRDWLTCGAYVVVVSLCAPLWEEAIFRGFLLASLTRALPPPGAALCSALVFALCHFRAETFAPLLLLGLVFGGLYVRTNNLLPPMLLHSLWNMYVLGTLVLRMRSGCDAVAASAHVCAVYAGLLGAAALGLRGAGALRDARRRRAAAAAAAPG
ncbi:hypothetical protein HT031_006687 [Scenedesmus sp. PABB004]|nr:hypothetical protein HT031_006687 [Scenedesmus sp. PABB004]